MSSVGPTILLPTPAHAADAAPQDSAGLVRVASAWRFRLRPNSFDVKYLG
jgi:hypothetical protein